MSNYDRGRDVSEALTEVRTVLSRAKSAIARLEYLANPPESMKRFYPEKDRDHDAMLFELQETVQSLSRWEKTGRPLKKRS